MSIYRFSDNSTIAEARFHAAMGRMPVVMLTAADHSDAARLADIRQAMQTKGWQCVPMTADGQEQLQVTGFKEVSDVTGLLRARQAITGEPEITVEENDLSGRGQKAWLSRSKLKIAGWLNAIGDMSLLAAGVKTKDHFMTAAGGFYTAGALVLGFFGNLKTEKQLRETVHETMDLVKQKTGQLPDSPDAHNAQLKSTGPLHRMEKFLYRHPVDTMLGAYSAGAVAMIGSGITQHNQQRVGYGIWSLLVKTTSFLLTEKKPAQKDDQNPARPDSIGGTLAWIKEKPLRLFGYGSVITEMLLGYSALNDFKSTADPKTKMRGIFGFFTTGAYILSDIVMATASKDPVNADGKFSTDEQLRIEALAAEMIAAQPHTHREKLASDVGIFLAKRPEMNGTGAQLGKKILEQAAHLPRNRWAARAAEEEAPVLHPQR